MSKNQRTFLSAVLAGISISLGCWISLSISSPMLGAMLFACGLLAVRSLKFDLFTGKTQFMTTKTYPASYYIVVLLGNITGCLFMAVIASVAVRSGAMSISLTKAEQTLLEAFSKATACGMLMTIATASNTPMFVSVMCVMAFILAGFNHCIADAFYMIAAKNFSWTWFATLAGNIMGGAILGLLNFNEKKGKKNERKRIHDACSRSGS